MDQVVTDLNDAQTAITNALAAVQGQSVPVPVNVVDPAWEAVKAALLAHGWTAPADVTTEAPVE